MFTSTSNFEKLLKEKKKIENIQMQPNMKKEHFLDGVDYLTNEEEEEDNSNKEGRRNNRNGGGGGSL